MRRRGHAYSVADLPAIDVVAIDSDGEPITEDAPYTARELIRSALESSSDLQPEPSVSTISGPNSAKPQLSRSRGCSEEVIAASLADPHRSVGAALDGILLEGGLPGLRLDAHLIEVEGARWGAALPVRVGTIPGLGRRATLRIFPSPSTNLTVVQLVPQHPRRLGLGMFVWTGVRAVKALCKRLDTTVPRREGAVSDTCTDIRTGV